MTRADQSPPREATVVLPYPNSGLTMDDLFCHRAKFTQYFFLRDADGPDQQEWKFFPQVRPLTQQRPHRILQWHDSHRRSTASCKCHGRTSSPKMTLQPITETTSPSCTALLALRSTSAVGGMDPCGRFTCHIANNTITGLLCCHVQCSICTPMAC